MIDLFDILSEKFESPKTAADLSSTIKHRLQQALSGLDLVTREEFDAQVAMLARSETRIRQLEQQLATLEEQAAKTSPKNPIKF